MIAAGERFRPWLEKRLGIELATDAVFIGRIKNGEVACVCGFSHWTGHDIELSVAGNPGSGSKDFLSVVFAYVFEQAGCVRCTVKTRESNAKAIKLATRLGFEPEGRLRNGFGDEAALIFGLLRQDYYGKRRRKATSGTGPGADHCASVAIQPVQPVQSVRDGFLVD